MREREKGKKYDVPLVVSEQVFRLFVREVLWSLRKLTEKFAALSSLFQSMQL